jgi:hypothetical protein
MSSPIANDGPAEPVLTAAQWQALTAVHRNDLKPDTGTSQPAMGEPVTQPATPPAPPTPPTNPAPPAPPAPGQPQPPAPPTNPAPPPGGGQGFVAPTPPAQQNTGPQSGGTHPGGVVQPKSGDADDADGFPANTPIAEMTAKQQAAYWKAQARKHEDRVKGMSDYDKYKDAFDEYQRLIAASQTEQEKAVAEARRQGRAEALAETGGQLVEQWVRAAAAGRLAEESVTALLAGLDRSRFLHDNGGVDTDKVYQFVGSIAPAAAPVAPDGQGVPVNPAQPPVTAAPPRVPDFGQGTPSSARPSGLAAGREIARQRFGSPANSAAS